MKMTLLESHLTNASYIQSDFSYICGTSHHPFATTELLLGCPSASCTARKNGV